MGPLISHARFILAALLVVSALAAVSGCGSSEETFTAGESDRALAALDSVQEYMDEGRCNSAESRVRALAVQSTRVNSDRPELGEAYASSVARLQELVARECVEISEPEPTEEVTPPTGETPEPTRETPEPTPEPDPAPNPDPQPEPTPDPAPDTPAPPDDTDSDDSGGASPQ